MGDDSAGAVEKDSADVVKDGSAGAGEDDWEGTVGTTQVAR